MSITRINFNPLSGGGDNPTGALVKLDANDADLDSRVTAAQTAATNAATVAQTASTNASAALTNASAANTKATTATTHITNSGIDVISAPQINPNQQQGTNLVAYNPASTDSSTMPTNAGFGTLVNISFTPGQFTQVATSITSPVMAFRNYNNAWGGWYYLWNTGNTTVDSNLFIKKAS